MHLYFYRTNHFSVAAVTDLLEIVDYSVVLLTMVFLLLWMILSNMKISYLQILVSKVIYRCCNLVKTYYPTSAVIIRISDFWLKTTFCIRTAQNGNISNTRKSHNDIRISISYSEVNLPGVPVKLSVTYTIPYNISYWQFDWYTRYYIHETIFDRE